MTMTKTTERAASTTPLFASSLPTPVGPFWLAVDGDGALVATAFGDRSVLQQRLLAAGECSEGGRAEKIAAAARSQLADWFAGHRPDFDLVLRPGGTPFQAKVWQALQRIPAGATRSYGALARELGSSPRAVGRANATNPICVVVPCHRVIGADGSLTGFAFGVAIKQWLLAHERAVGIAP
jgi:methylated-DNA-[protein]-cysteine S-methyltransferase